MDNVGTIVGARGNFRILTFLDILNPPFSPPSMWFKYSQCLQPELDLSFRVGEVSPYPLIPGLNRSKIFPLFTALPQSSATLDNFL